MNRPVAVALIIVALLMSGCAGQSITFMPPGEDPSKSLGEIGNSGITEHPDAPGQLPKPTTAKEALDTTAQGFVIAVLMPPIIILDFISNSFASGIRFHPTIPPR